ncbi:major allergen Asp F2 [Metarhizium robertsii ARSEF 23]|uniref:Major allergen Asp F2 n=1 Tax=Metarhizium robertsii (strain ARSEF 23 / ATCC MYA-3075) TaxID=655844 RepID=E9F6U2_METRA|nr:major allergen Asp F2 [Metarhizium robertsii ARSEF 23]EFY96494.1 major allergen Asp F2 [Metarhizium robertsii ARSEF 23]
MYAIIALLFLSPIWASPLGRPADELIPTIDASAKASPTPADYQWSAGWTATIPIHESCNSSFRAQINQGLDEMVQLSEHARNHLLRWGHKSTFTQRYFGNGSTAHAIGWYDRIILADKSDMLFRCDDPDSNCDIHKDWGSYWRPNATAEVNVCPFATEYRLLSSVCNLGHTVAGSGLELFWATDLMHRLFHAPIVNEDIVNHFSDDYSGLLELAKTEPEKSGIDMDALQYFAIDVWAHDVAAPGVGCTGKPPPKKSPAESVSGSPATATATAASSCHTHSDGSEHCV